MSSFHSSLSHYETPFTESAQHRRTDKYVLCAQHVKCAVYNIHTIALVHMYICTYVCSLNSSIHCVHQAMDGTHNVAQEKRGKRDGHRKLTNL